MNQKMKIIFAILLLTVIGSYACYEKDIGKRCPGNGPNCICCGNVCCNIDNSLCCVDLQSNWMGCEPNYNYCPPWKASNGTFIVIQKITIK